MPAKSKAQQKAAGAALSAKRGETPKRKLKAIKARFNRLLFLKVIEIVPEVQRAIDSVTSKDFARRANSSLFVSYCNSSEAIEPVVVVGGWASSVHG